MLKEELCVFAYCSHVYVYVYIVEALEGDYKLPAGKRD